MQITRSDPARRFRAGKNTHYARHNGKNRDLSPRKSLIERRDCARVSGLPIRKNDV
jgi:hypothetical protein